MGSAARGAVLFPLLFSRADSLEVVFLAQDERHEAALAFGWEHDLVPGQLNPRADLSCAS
jgi:hypothetical protein